MQILAFFCSQEKNVCETERDRKRREEERHKVELTPKIIKSAAIISIFIF